MHCRGYVGPSRALCPGLPGLMTHLLRYMKSCLSQSPGHLLLRRRMHARLCLSHCPYRVIFPLLFALTLTPR